MVHQWRGVVEEYREWLPVDEHTPVITLGEGGTPLVHSDWLSGVVGGDVWLKVEGDNPTGSFKDRGMTAAISVAAGEGAKATVCASTGNTSASMAAYASRAGLTPIVLVPHGRIAAGKMAQTVMHGAEVIQVRGGFDECLQIARELAEQYPVALVNSVNPVRLQGQKTAAFEIVDALGRAPDVHVLPVGNAGNISAYWIGFKQYAKAGLADRTPQLWGYPGRRCRPDRARRAHRESRDRCVGHPHRQPGVVAARRVGPRRLRRPHRGGHRRADPGCAARAELA